MLPCEDNCLSLSHVDRQLPFIQTRGELFEMLIHYVRSVACVHTFGDLYGVVSVQCQQSALCLRDVICVPGVTHRL